MAKTTTPDVVAHGFRFSVLVVCALSPLLFGWPGSHVGEARPGQGGASSAGEASLFAAGGGQSSSFEHPVARDYFDRAMRAFNEAEQAAERLEAPERTEAERSRLRASRRQALREGGRLLQRILDDPILREAVLFDDEAQLFLGASRLVRRTLREHGEQAIELYREAVRSTARRAHERARYRRDAEALLELVLRYPFAEAALEAGVQAAHLFWEAGEFERAAALARRLLEHESLDEEHGASLVALAAYVYAKQGQHHEARDVQRLAEQRFPEFRLATGHRTQPLERVLREQLARAEQEAEQGAHARCWPSQASSPRGDSTVANGKIETTEISWHRRMPDPTRHGPSEHYRPQYPSFELPRRLPAANESILVMPNRTGVRVYNLRDGEERFRYDIYPEPRHGSRSRGRTGGFWLDEQRNRDPASIDTATIHGDEVYLPLEQPMDYELHDPFGVGQLRHHNLRRSGAIIVPHAPRRKLYSFDVQTGDPRWRIGASWKDREDPIAETLSYTTAPLVRDERVYTSAAKVLDENAHIFVLALSREAEQPNDNDEVAKPTVHWKTKVGAGLQETNLFGRPTREPVPSALAYESHRIFLSTNIGTVVALDTLTGEQLWSYPYERISFVPPVQLRNYYRELTWFNVPPVVHEGRVYVGPMDSRKLYCLDAETGEKLWELPWGSRASRRTPRYLLGVHDDRLYWIGERYLYWSSIDQPRVQSLDVTRTLRANITGRPIIVNGVLYAATSNNQIARIDLERHRLLPALRGGLASIGGNLAFADGGLIAATDQVVGVARDDAEPPR